MRLILIGFALVALPLKAFSEATIICSAQSKTWLIEDKDYGRKYSSEEAYRVTINGNGEVQEYKIGSCNQHINAITSEDSISIKCALHSDRWPKADMSNSLEINRYTGKYTLWEYMVDGNPMWFSEGECFNQERKF